MHHYCAIIPLEYTNLAKQYNQNMKIQRDSVRALAYYKLMLIYNFNKTEIWNMLCCSNLLC